ncbi:jg21422 [Pararge aegeria aegeria]|uniref:Jg21422 protein n=1 Tax=Pararge aegeria aegeria TaxID=348720 RepID=A0A8S4QIG5_9NEOP|nr:jg21422 [Pararge aegeria aegeria]
MDAPLYVTSSKIPKYLKTKVFEQCVLLVVNYVSETRSLSIDLIRRLRFAQRATKRAMLGVYLLGQIGYGEIRRRTRVTDVAQRVAKLKWQWAEHIARITDERWDPKVLELLASTKKRSVVRLR